MLQIL